MADEVIDTDTHNAAILRKRHRVSSFAGRYELALKAIAEWGHGEGHGCGYTCATIAKEALDG